MRKIEIKAIALLEEGMAGRAGKNDFVESYKDSMIWRYHGSPIVRLEQNANGKRVCIICDCDFRTHSTMSRLNAALAQYGQSRIFQKDLSWYHGPSRWSGYFQFDSQ